MLIQGYAYSQVNSVASSSVLWRQRMLNAFIAVALHSQAWFSRLETFFAKKARFSEQKTCFFTPDA